MKHYTFDNAAVLLAGVNAAREFLQPIFTDRDRELLVIALCDEDVRLMQLLTIPGTETYVNVSLPEILRHAVCSKCSGVILAHNHPSRDKRPSSLDMAITRRLVLAAEAMDITLLDHLIFNHGPALSLRERGFI